MSYYTMPHERPNDPPEDHQEQTEQTEEQYIVAEAKKGNTKALGDFLTAQLDKMRGAVRKIVRNTDAVDDIVQTACAIALKNIDTFRGASSLNTWMLGIAKNVALVKGRELQRWKKRHVGGNTFADKNISDYDGDELPNHTPPQLRSESAEKQVMDKEILAIIDKTARAILGPTAYATTWAALKEERVSRQGSQAEMAERIFRLDIEYWVKSFLQQGLTIEDIQSDYNFCNKFGAGTSVSIAPDQSIEILAIDKTKIPSPNTVRQRISRIRRDLMATLEKKGIDASILFGE